MHTLAVVFALLAGVQKGGTLYVKGEAVVMTAKANGSGAKTPLPAGTEVVWQGADARHKSMELIEWKGKRGYVPMESLTPNRAQEEPTSPPAAGTPPPTRTSDDEKAVLEKLAQLTASTEEQQAKVAEHAKKNGLKAGK